jgi:hypothetical protein
MLKNQGQRSTMETMQRLASQMDGLALANRGLKSIRPAKKIVAMPKRVKKTPKAVVTHTKTKETEFSDQSDEGKSNSNQRSRLNDSAIDLANESPEIKAEIPIEPKILIKNSNSYSEEDPIKSSESDHDSTNQKPESSIRRCKHHGDAITTTSGYGSETSLDSENSSNRIKLKSNNEINHENEETGDTHCVRCHKVFDPSSSSPAEMRCVLPHPTKSVVPIKRDQYGTDFACLCCRTEFRLPKMAFYEAGVNSMLTGFCFIGHHTTDQNDIDYQQDGGAALCCEEAGCIEYFV